MRCMYYNDLLNGFDLLCTTQIKLCEIQLKLSLYELFILIPYLR